jgi:peptidylprolyl isomerase
VKLFPLMAAASAAVLLAAPTLVAAKAKPAKAAELVTPKPEEWIAVDPNNLLVIETSKGRILLELYPWIAPKTVAQVRQLAHEHFYDGLNFFRVIDGFMDQTGDPTNTGEGGSKLPNTPGEFTFRRSGATTFLQVSDEDPPVGFVGPMVVQSKPTSLMSMTVDGAVAAFGMFCPGVAGMARTAQDVNSANSQFFLMRQEYPSLNHNYTPFGRVLVGQDVVRAIKVGEPPADPRDVMTTVRLAADLPEAQRPKLYRIDTSGPYFKLAVERLKQIEGSGYNPCETPISVQQR